jgi:hypothetical protein
MKDDRVIVDVPMVRSLGDAIWDVWTAFYKVDGQADTLGGLTDTTGTNLVSPGEWNEVWYKYAAYLNAVHDVLNTAREQVHEIGTAVKDAAETYLKQDQANETVLALRPPEL